MKASIDGRIRRLERLEQDAEGKGATKFDEAAWELFKATLDDLDRQRDALLKARESLPLEKRLALARQDQAAALNRPDYPNYGHWGHGMKVRALEIELLERDGLATDKQLADLREGRLRVPLGSLPVVLDVAPMLDDEMRRVEREIDEWVEQNRALRDAAWRQPTPPDHYQKLREELASRR